MTVIFQACAVFLCVPLVIVIFALLLKSASKAEKALQEASQKEGWQYIPSRIYENNSIFGKPNPAFDERLEELKPVIPNFNNHMKTGKFFIESDGGYEFGCLSYAASTGRSTISKAVYWVKSPTSFPPMELHRQNVGHTIMQSTGATEITTGNQQFDQTFWIQSNYPELMKSQLSTLLMDTLRSAPFNHIYAADTYLIATATEIAEPTLWQGRLRDLRKVALAYHS